MVMSETDDADDAGKGAVEAPKDGETAAATNGVQSDDFGAGAYNKNNAFFKTLWKGFREMRESREDKRKPLFDIDPDGNVDPLQAESKLANCVAVNFIDPTTTGPSTPSANTSNMLRAAQKQNGPAEPKISDVYEKLTYIFGRDYGSTLKSVPYKSARSGSSEVIPSLPVRAVLTRSHGSSGSANGDASVPWGGTAGSAAAPVSDPSEWHSGPYCHCYIAACESLEHYRTKIRPSLQAFVSQIEAAATNFSTSSSTAHYLIVYVPCGPKTAAGEPEGGIGSGRVGTALASRLQKARQRITNMNANAEMSNDSFHSTDSLDSSDLATRDNSDAEPGVGAVSTLSRAEKEIYKKINADFPNGKTCVLSTSSLDTSEDDATSDSGLAIKTQEWNSFNRSLGSVIVNGFRDRCRRYIEELRRLDAQRHPPKEQQKNKTKGRSSIVSFNLSYFFLVKESLAFTFEQMQLPAEALLQYDELRAFLPDFQTKRSSRRSSSKSAEDLSGPPLSQLADAGDCGGFRRRIRSETDLAPVLDIVKRYLFARELSLLFKMEQPVELLSRCSIYLEAVLSSRMRGLAGMSENEKQQCKLESTKWAVNFLWDVKSACERSFTSFIARDTAISDTMSVDTPASDYYSEASTEIEGQSERAVARRLSEMIEGARLCLKQLGDSELEGPNPARTDEKWVPDDMFTSWGPWKPGPARKTTLAFDKQFERSDDALEVDANRALFLDDAFSSAEAFEMKYLEMTLAVVSLCRFSERRRMASRLQGEVAEYFIRKGDFWHAAKIIKVIVKRIKEDQWDRCHFWRLFRLVYCQRATAKSTDYLKTLVTCFSPRIARIAPTKALNILQDDLEVVMEDPVVGEASYGKLAFIETGMELVGISSDESTIGTGTERKALLKRYCTVGESIRIVLTVNCYLPRNIFLESLKLFIVTFATFSTILEKSDSVEEEDACKVIALDSPVELKSGANKYCFDWIPMTAGQYILSTVEIKWKQGCFYYDSMELGGPLLGVDVHPSESTHSLSIDPSYLVPGHTQQAKITFDAGSDMVTGGKLQLQCSGGLKLIPPGEEPTSGNWQNSCDIELSPCKPGEQTVFITHVKCDALAIAHARKSDVSSVSSGDGAPGLSARAFTKYVHYQNDEVDHSKTPHMKTVLETASALLESSALTVDDVCSVWNPVGDRAVVTIALSCHAPSLFAVDKWKLFLPPPLQVTENGDLNVDLLKCSVTDGDELSFAFECVVGGGPGTSSSDEPILNLELIDEIGKICSLDLPLDLTDLYREASVHDESDKTLSVALVLDTNEAQAGEPVNMAYKIDCSKLSNSNDENDQLIYSVSPEGSCWLLGGKVDGIVNFEKSTRDLSIDIVGIPTVAGLINEFPSIVIKHKSRGGVTLLPVQVQYPAPFASRNYITHVAVAAPSVVVTKS